MSRPASEIQEIIVHCLATRRDWWAGRSNREKLEEVRRWHTAPKPVGRAWKEIAYASVIFFDGERLMGRDLDGDGDPFNEVGAHTVGRNLRSVGIALEGGFGSSENDQFSDHFTPEQDLALRAEIERIERYCGRKLPVRGHNEFAAKACPGFNVARWYAGQPPRTLAASSTLQAAGGGAAATAVGAVSAVSALDGQAQVIALVVAGVIALAFAWIARERIRLWVKGVH